METIPSNEYLAMALTKLRGCADGSDSPNNWVALVRDECRAILAELKRSRDETSAIGVHR